MPVKRRKPMIRDLVDELQSEGRYTFSFAEMAAAFVGSDTALRSALRRLKEKARLVSPRREFYVIVPVEYRVTGSPPASWFVDDLMRFLGQPYYVGLLSAATVHGASHQQPQLFQVVTHLPTLKMSAGRVRLAFTRRRKIKRIETVRVKTETGYMTVSIPEATVFDLIRHFRLAGHLSNVATVLAELTEVINLDKLAVAAGAASIPDVQRAGYLFELTGHAQMARRLEEYLSTRRVRPALLRPGADSDGDPFDERWRLVINDQVEPDL